MKKFEKIQQQILDSTSLNQLVMAGAGSGKTTVMVEKIANLILSGEARVDELLVVTFTVLAAGEMKDRLIAKISSAMETATELKKAELQNTIEQIKTASIDTIDGFNSKTIRKYFYELNLSPNLEIISDATRDYYLTIAMKRTMEKLSKNTEKVSLMLDLFAGNSRNFDALEQLVLSCFNNLSNLENYQEFLAASREEYVNSINSEKVVNDYVFSHLQSVKNKVIENFSSIENSPAKQKLQTLVSDLDTFNPALSFSYNLNVLNNLNLPNFTPTEKKQNPALNDIILQIKKLNSVKTKIEENGINENFSENNAKILEYFDIFIEILTDFINFYNSLKEKNNLLDFADLTKLMLKLLEKENIRNELINKYKFIFIDEYQDVNPLQDALIKKLQGVNTKVFTVGDVKQSIYGFRGTNPEWMVEKYNSLQNSKNGEVFNMNVNFRSNPKVLNFINAIFSKLMTKYSADIDYATDCLIDPKRTDIVDDDVKILLVKDEKQSDLASGIYSVKTDTNHEKQTARTSEALLVLKTITELVGTTFYDANLKQNRTLTYKDIAILTHSDKDENSKVLIDLLKQNSIPLNLTNKLDVTNCEGVKLILSILKCVTHAADDVDYLATFMALTDLQIDEVIELRDKSTSLFENLQAHMENENVKHGFKSLAKIRQMSYVSTNSQLIQFVLNDLHLKYYLLQMENGENQLALLDEFLNKLSPIEDGLSLSEFILVVESNVGKGSDFSVQDKPNSVTLQTIHKSKGLEYPVVIVFNASKQFSYIGEKEGINFNSSIGLGFDYFDKPNRTKKDSLTKFAIKILNAKKGYKEELRLLYVALTRAKNKLVITGTYSDKVFTDEINKTSFTAMLLDCFNGQLSEGENKFENCQINFFAEPIVPTNETTNEQPISNDYVQFSYSNQNKFNIPLKNTVTGINSQKSQDEKFETKKWFNPVVQYTAEDDKAVIGTLYHKALEKLDLTSAYLQNTNFEEVDYVKIKKAHEVLSKLTCGAKEIKKEAEFMMYLPYKNIVDSNIEDKVLVQGVVDLLIIKENSAIIVDYKFSHLPGKVLKAKYAEQLALYKQAVELAYNLPVSETLIYSIQTSELI